MRTNIEIDDELMAKAMAVCGAKSKREAVEKGLKSLLRSAAYESLRALRGQVEWEGDLEAMRTDKSDSKWL